MVLVNETKRVVGSERHVSLSRAPCKERSPLLVSALAFSVFEVAVLNEFGIKAAIGGIANVFEEHANELVANLLLLLRINVYPCFQLLAHDAFEALWVVS